MAHPEFKMCDKYGLVRNYKMETDFMITAKQVEKLLGRVEDAMDSLRSVFKNQQQRSSLVHSSSLDELLHFVEELAAHIRTGERLT